MAASAASTWTSFRHVARANSWRAPATATMRRWPALPPPPANNLSNSSSRNPCSAARVRAFSSPPPSGESPAAVSCLCSGRSSDRFLTFLAGAPGSIFYLGLGVNISYPSIAPIAIKPPTCHHPRKPNGAVPNLAPASSKAPCTNDILASCPMNQDSQQFSASPARKRPVCPRVSKSFAPFVILLWPLFSPTARCQGLGCSSPDIPAIKNEILHTDDRDAILVAAAVGQVEVLPELRARMKPVDFATAEGAAQAAAARLGDEDAIRQLFARLTQEGDRSAAFVLG